jgi:hypothetical protein
MTAAMPGASRVRRVLRIASVLIVACAIVYAIEPFSTSGNSPVPSSTAHCGAALFGAWRGDKQASGWFGYAPLTKVTAPASVCRGASRHRLEFSVGGLVLGAGLAILARRTDRHATSAGADH